MDRRTKLSFTLLTFFSICGCAPQGNAHGSQPTEKGFFNFHSPDSIVKNVVSPDQHYTAVLLYGRSSGPEGGYCLVAMRGIKEALRFNKEGEVEDISEGGQVVFSNTGQGTDIRDLTWKNKRRLIISGVCYDGSSAPSTGSTKWRDIEIAYPDCPSKFSDYYTKKK